MDFKKNKKTFLSPKAPSVSSPPEAEAEVIFEKTRRRSRKSWHDPLLLNSVNFFEKHNFKFKKQLFYYHTKLYFLRLLNKHLKKQGISEMLNQYCSHNTDT